MRAGLEVKISQMLLQQEELHSIQSKVELKAAEQQVTYHRRVAYTPPNPFTSSHLQLIARLHILRTKKQQ